MLREYVWLDGQPLVLAEYTGANAGVYFYLNDHLGTPQQLLNGDTGAVVWQAAYLPFGEVQISVNTVTNNLRFPGQYYDAETGLHYNWNRYYDPASGRYISADPIGLEGGANLYLYVNNNPISFIDINGFASYKDFEGHFVNGIGLTAIFCCTEKGEALSQIYIKLCLGSAFGLSLGFGGVTNSDGKSCSNPPKRLLSGELGIALGVIGGEASFSVDVGGSGSSISGGVGMGTTLGLSISATGCFYQHLCTAPSPEQFYNCK